MIFIKHEAEYFYRPLASEILHPANYHPFPQKNFSNKTTGFAFGELLFQDAVRNQKEDLSYDSNDLLYKFGFGLSYK